MDLIYDIGSAEAVNKKGLRRAKKEPQQLEQQDSFVAQWPFGQSPKLALACVFDGHGGAMESFVCLFVCLFLLIFFFEGRQCSEAAREVLPRHLRKRLRALAKAGVRSADLATALTDVFRTTDARLLARQHLYEGCTATVAVIWSVQVQTNSKNRFDFKLIILYRARGDSRQPTWATRLLFWSAQEPLWC